MPATPFHQTRGPVTRVPPPGEEPWYDDNGCGYIDIDGVTGNKYFVWGRNGGGGGVTVTGPATKSYKVTTTSMTMWLVQITGNGPVTINVDACDFGGIVAHKLPPGSPIETSCG